MSELNFNVLGNNADLQKESQLLHEAISGLESPVAADILIRCFRLLGSPDPPDSLFLCLSKN